MSLIVQNRYDFDYLFDVQDGNPNGDPDAGNLPRIDPETGNGLVTDVCLKRKVRNYVGLAKQENPPYEIYVKEKAILNKQHARAYSAEGLELPGGSKKTKAEDVEKAKLWMCQNFFDIRTFGAVMSTEVNCGQVRGPVQITFARSIVPVVPSEHSITRMAVTTEREAESQEGGNRTMGRKHTIPYGLYRAHGFISAHLAEQTRFSEDDLALLWEALTNMFEHDHSAARGQMATRGLYAFKHSNKLGHAPAHSLFERIKVAANTNVPRGFADFTVTVDSHSLPEGVELIRIVG